MSSDRRTIGDVGRGATVFQGDHNTLIINEKPIDFIALPLTSLHQLPPAPALIGRDEDLLALEEKLYSDNAVGVTISAARGKRAGVQGMPGVGKTSLAVVLAHQLKERYPDAQIYLNMRGADVNQRPAVTPVEAMQSVIHAFHPEARLPNTLDELTPLYRSVLSDNIERDGNKVERKLILILDNASGASQILPLLPPPNCLLLVTSRAQFKLPGVTTLILNSLKPSQSQELLLKLAPRITGYEQIAAELCGHLPLKLEIFAMLVEEHSIYSVPELVQFLRLRKHGFAPEDSVFQVSYDLLPVEHRSRWAQLGVFPASFDLHAAAAVWNESISKASEIMQELVNASLVEWNELDNRFRLHDLIHVFCDDKLTALECNEARFRHAQHYARVLETLNTLYNSGSDGVMGALRGFDVERLNIETGQKFVAGDETNQAFARVCVDYGTLAKNILRIRLHLRLQIEWAGTALRSSELVRDKAGKAKAVGELGVAYKDLGDTKRAIPLLEQQRSLCTQLGDREGISVALGNLGLAYKDLGENKRAVESFEGALQIVHEVGNKRLEAICLSNLGYGYEILGDSERAIQYLESALVIASEAGNRHTEGSVLHHLSISFKSRKDILKTLECSNEALRIFQEIGDRRWEAYAYSGIGNAYFELGDKEKAIGPYELELAISREVGDKSLESTALGHLAAAYVALGNEYVAVDYMEQALRIDEEIGVHFDDAKVGNVGSHFATAKNWPKAIYYAEEALEKARANGNRQNEGIWLHNLAEASLALGELDKCITLCEEALAIAIETEFRLLQGNVLSLWAQAFHGLGDENQAIYRAESALRAYEDIQAPEAASIRAHLSVWRDSEQTAESQTPFDGGAQ